MLGGLLEIVSIDTGCGASTRSTGLQMAIGVIVVDDGATNETEYYEAINEFLSAGNETLSNNGLTEWKVDEEPEYLEDFETEEDNVVQEFQFELTSMDETFTNEAEPVNEAGKKVYFSLSQTGSEMGEFLEYTVSKCEVIQENGNNFSIYDHGDGCGSSNVDGVLQKVDSENSYRFDLEYILFMFSGETSTSEYSLVCEVMLCLVADENSVCRQVSESCT